MRRFAAMTPTLRRVMSPRLEGAFRQAAARPQYRLSGHVEAASALCNAERDHMDSWEWNKIAGAVLGTLIFCMVIGLFAEAVYTVPTPAKPGYVVPGVAATTAASTGPAAPVEEPLPDFASVIPTADLKKGEQIAQRCAQCHDWSKGGPNKIGPNLYGIVGDKRGEGRNNYDFSSAMKSKGGSWTYDELFRFLKQPQVYIPGTKMTFAGLPSAQDRIDIIAYMRTWADTPFPLPPPQAAKPADDKSAPPKK
jgi:cytochrome c